jgi:hypothetical protein
MSSMPSGLYESALPAEGHLFPIYLRDDETSVGPCSRCVKEPHEVRLGPGAMAPCEGTAPG